MYNVGQILFVVLNKKPQIIPVKVIEQVVRRTADGENIQYSVTVPTSAGDKVFELTDLDGEVYTSISDVEIAMLENARSMIKRMSEKAFKVAESKFEYSVEPTSEEISLPEVSHNQNNSGFESPPVSQTTIQLEDGTIAKVSLPGDLGLNIPE